MTRILSNSFSTWMLAAAAACFLAGCGTTAGIRSGAQRNANTGADAYYEWLLTCLDGFEEDLPLITESAEAAARLYVLENYDIKSRGEMSLICETQGRSGGLMRINLSPRNPRGLAVVLFGVREKHLEEDLAEMAKFKKRGNLVIALGREEVLRDAPCDWQINYRAAEHGGLLPSGDGRWVVPTSPAANIAVAWTWMGEFVAACTRLGKMPTMFQGFAVPGGKDRARKLGYRGPVMKFHDGVPPKVKPGRLGRTFIRELRKDLKKVRKYEMADIRAAAALAAKARRNGRNLYVFLHGHAVLRQMGCAYDPGYFLQINKNWTRVEDGFRFEPGDFILCIGFDNLFRGASYDGFAQKAREAGVTLVWSITTYKKAEVDAVAPGELLIDQHWDFGDAVVPVPGYDIKILPTSGVIAEAILWMINAELHTILPSE